MKKSVSVSDLKVGFILEEDIKTDDDKILIRKGSVLTENLIFRLRRWSSKGTCVVIDDNGEVCLNPKEIETKAISSIDNLLNSSYENLGNAIADLERFASHIYDDLKKIKDLPDDVIEIHYASQGSHYFRIAKMAVALASLYNDEVTDDKKVSLESVFLATLLHDYGKRFRNDSASLEKLREDKSEKITSKLLDGPYNDKYHTVYAYVALRGIVPEDVRRIILFSKYANLDSSSVQHPLDVQAAKIVSLCDIYDSLLEYVINKDLSDPFENVISYMGQLAHNNSLDNEVYKLFLRHIPIYPVGSKVLLSNDKYAVVVRKVDEFPTKPVVLTLPPATPELVDLSEVMNVTIRTVISKGENKVDFISNNQIDNTAHNVTTLSAPDDETPDTLFLQRGVSDQTQSLKKNLKDIFKKRK